MVAALRAPEDPHVGYAVGGNFARFADAVTSGAARDAFNESVNPSPNFNPAGLCVDPAKRTLKKAGLIVAGFVAAVAAAELVTGLRGQALSSW